MSILISDFDGTLTRYDFFELVRKRWPFPPEDDPWEKFVSGEITHFEALAEIFAHIRTSEADLLALANSMELDLSFAKSARELQNRRWEIVIASAGWIKHQGDHGSDKKRKDGRNKQKGVRPVEVFAKNSPQLENERRTERKYPELSKWNRYRTRLRSQKLPQSEKWDSCSEQNPDGGSQGSQCTKDIRAMQGGRFRMLRAISRLGSRRSQTCDTRFVFRETDAVFRQENRQEQADRPTYHGWEFIIECCHDRHRQNTGQDRKLNEKQVPSYLVGLHVPSVGSVSNRRLSAERSPG
jgi:hypothetical protein